MAQSTCPPDPERYLDPCDVMDFETPIVRERARQLVGATPLQTAKTCFEFVRDRISHSGDVRASAITCSASETLREGTGYCYAKSHLLCALFRANQLPAGLCYQRLSVDGDGAPFCLHGLAAVFLPDSGWYRIDPRGNRDEIDAQFCPPTQRLAFTPKLPEERDLPEIHVKPLAQITRALRRHTCCDAFESDLPDLLPA